MTERVYVAGVGMTKFEKIQSRDWTYPQMVAEAVGQALTDAGVRYDQVQRAAVGYVFQPSTAGQRALYDIGLTGIPMVNVNNNCATGSTALVLAREWVQAGLADIVLAVGFEQMTKQAMSGDGTVPKVTTVDWHMDALKTAAGFSSAPMTAQFFGAAANEHMKKYGTTREQLAQVAVKNHEHSTRNPKAQFQDAYTLDQVLDDKLVSDPLTRSQCSPMSDGAGAAVLVSERYVREHGLDRAVPILAQELVTDTGASFESGSMIDVVGAPMARIAGQKVLETAGVGVEDIDVLELHDCFSINELLTYEALGLCGEGESGALVESGATTYGGQWVVNPSGGLISKGHPLGATGLAQCTELVTQVRGAAGARQVEGARLGLAHNLGLGGACVVTLYGAPGAVS